MTHDYTSTACLHGEHEQCRMHCKFCGAECRCGCHRNGQSHAARRYIIVAMLMDAMQGQDAFYDLKLNCGHWTRVPSSRLSAVVCNQCPDEP